MPAREVLLDFRLSPLSRLNALRALTGAPEAIPTADLAQVLCEMAAVARARTATGALVAIPLDALTASLTYQEEWLVALASSLLVNRADRDGVLERLQAMFGEDNAVVRYGRALVELGPRGRLQE